MANASAGAGSTHGNAVGIALRSYLAILLTGRRSRWVLAGLGLVLVGAAALHLTDVLGPVALRKLRVGLLLQAMPIVALLLAESPLRDGINHRTLLPALLSPVPRGTLVLARSAITWALLWLAMAVLVVGLGVVSGASSAELTPELAALTLGSVCYSGLFAALHLLTRRGLVVGLVALIFGDFQIARIPFGLRQLAPITHVEAVAGRSSAETFGLPLQVATPSTTTATLVLLGLGALGFALAVWRFRQQNLGELC